jgi:hypothetical protein
MLKLLYSFSSKSENIRLFCSVDQQLYAIGINNYYCEGNVWGYNCETCDKEVSFGCFSL